MEKTAWWKLDSKMNLKGYVDLTEDYRYTDQSDFLILRTIVFLSPEEHSLVEKRGSHCPKPTSHVT